MSDPNMVKNAFVQQLFVDIKAAGGKPYLVGGCVRDIVINGPRFTPKDIDIEVFGITEEKLKEALDDYSISFVGQSFGVFKIHKWNIDISIPRRETKTGDKHTDFEIELCPDISIKEAASRRDFTMNAMYMDIDKGLVITDPFGGQKDIKNKVIRHTSEKFGEDPLRVLRAMQFAARLDFDVAPETIALCSNLSMDDIPKERVFEEFSKLILRGHKISKGLKFLRDCQWTRFFPEFMMLMGSEQSPEWHAEGDVWNHTLMCMDEFAWDLFERGLDSSRIPDDYEDLVVGLAVLCHDFGKPYATTYVDGKIHHYGHEKMGAEPTLRFLFSLTNQGKLVSDAVTLVENHHRPAQLYPFGSNRAMRKLARDVERIDRLVRVVKADLKGRKPPHKRANELVEWILDKAKNLKVEDCRPDPIIMGRHLIRLGLKPSKDFGYILKGCYEAQLNEEFVTEAGGMIWLKNLLNEWSK